MECPTCEKSLPTEQGMRIHHATVHGVSLPNRECKGCSTVFYDSDSKRAYCDQCNPNAGSNNGNWSGATERSECTICGESFEYYPSNKEGQFCSRCVEKTNAFLGDRYVKDADYVERECRMCDEQMNILKSRVKRGGGTFCSRDCHSRWMSENRVGRAHHQWEGGPIEYGRKWWQIRRRALERDEYTCQHCGKTKSELGQNPDVHHIERVRSFEDPQDAHTLDNIVSLCRSCHRNAEEGNFATLDTLSNDGR